VEKTARLYFDGTTYDVPVVIGTEGELGLDISNLRQETGLITFDPGFKNTGSCKSSITYIDGEDGILRYRGIPIEQLVENSRFVETAYLLINNALPTADELSSFSQELTHHSLIHEDMLDFFEKYPPRTHPMGILSSMVNALGAFYPELQDASRSETINVTVARLLSKIRTLAAVSYNISIGHKVIYPRHDLSYCANFLYMMFESPVKPYLVDAEIVKALNVFWILHADHEQNCSTTAVRLIGSAGVNLYAAVSAGISALWGPLHGGANQAVIEMLQKIEDNGGDITPFITRAKDKEDPFRLMGFGHRVYKTFDPRAPLMEKIAELALRKMNRHDPLLDIARRLRDATLNDSYFVDHHLYPNVDFYSGIFLRAIGIPLNMFTVMFAIGRLPGWISQWKESLDDPDRKLDRPRQIYTGPLERDYTPIVERNGCVTLKSA